MNKSKDMSNDLFHDYLWVYIINQEKFGFYCIYMMAENKEKVTAMVQC